MKLDRNLNDNSGRGKYALLLLRGLKNHEHGAFQKLSPGIRNAIKTLENAGLLDWGIAKTGSEFFVIRLKDMSAQAALLAYAKVTDTHNIEWAAEVRELASRSGPSHPNCKWPD